MATSERSLSGADYRRALPHYIGLAVIAAALVAGNLLWIHVRGGQLREATTAICFTRTCPRDQLNLFAAVALLLPVVLPRLLNDLSLLAPTAPLASACRWLTVLAVGGLLAHGVDEFARFHRATVTIGGTSTTANGFAELAGIIGVGVIGSAGLVRWVLRRLGSSA